MIEELHKLKGILFPINYRGCLVTPLVGGYEAFGRKVRTPKEVDDLIDDAHKVIENSIKKP